MNIYIVIKDGVVHNICYTSIKTTLDVVKGPHLQTIYKNLRKSGIYNKNGLLIKKLILQKLPVRHKYSTINKKKEKLRTNNLSGSNQRFTSNTSEVDILYDE